MPTIAALISAIHTTEKRYTSLLPGLVSFRRNRRINLEVIEKAFVFAQEAHKGQVRKSGEPYISHALSTAIILAEMGLDQDIIVAGLLHDVPEDTAITLVDIEKNFGPTVAQLVGGITKLGKLKYRGAERYAENLRRMFVSMAKDIRVVLIKMADRLHNLTTLKALPPEKQLRIAKESLEIYAPIANRLGMGSIKGQLEDLSFPFVLPKEYAWMQKEIIPRISTRVEYINQVVAILRKKLVVEKIKIISMHGRVKRQYSLYQKLKRPEYDFDLDKIFDLVAIRIIVPTISDCYHVMGLLHKYFRPLPGRIKDYIAQPKPNGYQSLHTTVFCHDGRVVEFQIRTNEMHEQAEFGIAAHWHYKEGAARDTKNIASISKQFKWLEDLVQWQKGMADNSEYLQSLSVDFFKNRIFVFTPKGDVIDLPEDATPVDFAYHLHSWIGDHCSGAKVNNLMGHLDQKLKSGDVVEIITDKNRKGPSRDWMNFVKTNNVRSKIKSKAPRH